VTTENLSTSVAALQRLPEATEVGTGMAVLGGAVFICSDSGTDCCSIYSPRT
jgi:hypothetical protein